MTVYVVMMYRYGDHENHSYVLGVYSTRDKAMYAGASEAFDRAGKYSAEVTEWKIDSEVSNDQR